MVEEARVVKKSVIAYSSLPSSSRGAKRRGDLMVIRTLITAGDYVDGQKSVS